MFVSSLTYLTLPRAPETWIIKDLLPAGGYLNIYGRAKSGKTILALQMASDISSGSSHFLSFPIHTHGPVAYLQIDTPRGLFCSNYIERFTSVGLDLSSLLIADSDLAPYPFSIIGEGGKWLSESLVSLSPPPIALIVDTLREIHSGDENDSGTMRNVFAALSFSSRVISPHPALIILSHSRKGMTGVVESSEDIMETNRGSNYVAGRVDGVIRVGNTRRGSTPLYYQSRTVEQTTLHTTRLPSGLFSLPIDPDLEAIDKLRQDNPTLSVNALAKLATTQLGRGSVSYWTRRLKPESSKDTPDPSTPDSPQSTYPSPTSTLPPSEPNTPL